MPFRFGIQLGLVLPSAFCALLAILPVLSIQPSSHPAILPPNAGPNPLASFHCPCRSVCRCLCPPGTMLTIKLNLFSYFVSLRFANSARPLKVKVLSSAADVADNYVPPARTQRTRTAEQGQRTADSLLALSCCKHGAKNSRVSNNRFKKKSWTSYFNKFLGSQSFFFVFSIKRKKIITPSAI